MSAIVKSFLSSPPIAGFLAQSVVNAACPSIFPQEGCSIASDGIAIAAQASLINIGLGEIHKGIEELSNLKIPKERVVIVKNPATGRQRLVRKTPTTCEKASAVCKNIWGPLCHIGMGVALTAEQAVVVRDSARFFGARISGNC